MDKNLSAFGTFLANEVVNRPLWALKTMSDGRVEIHQTERNNIRSAGLEALKADLETLYGDAFDIVETEEGIIIVAEVDEANGEPDSGFTFSWEIKCTIKSTAFDPFIAADRYDEAKAQKEITRAAREAANAAKEAKRAAKLAALAGNANTFKGEEG